MTSHVYSSPRRLVIRPVNTEKTSICITNHLADRTPHKHRVHAHYTEKFLCLPPHLRMHSTIITQPYVRPYLDNINNTAAHNQMKGVNIEMNKKVSERDFQFHLTNSNAFNHAKKSLS